MRLFKRAPKASAEQAPKHLHGAEHPFLAPAGVLDLGGDTAAGRVVTPDTALTSIAVYAAVRVIAESIASLPVHVYRRDGRSRVRVDDDREFILSQEPNPYMDAMSFWSNLVDHANLWGNGYALLRWPFARWTTSKS